MLSSLHRIRHGLIIFLSWVLLACGVLVGLPWLYHAVLGDVGFTPTRYPIEHLLKRDEDFRVRANFETGWTHRVGPQPIFEGFFDYAGDYACEITQAEPATLDAQWWQDGRLPQPGGMITPVVGTFNLGLKDERFEPPNVRIEWTGGPQPNWRSSHGGWWWTSGGASAANNGYVCLEPGRLGFLPGDRGAAEGLTAFFYCRVGLWANTGGIEFVDFADDQAEYGQPLNALVSRGSCVPAASPAAALYETMDAPAGPAPSPAPASPATMQAPEPSPSVAMPSGGQTLASQPRGSCTVTLAGRAECEPTADICQTNHDGLDVACGGMANICITSADGLDVACGGLANYCNTSADGLDVACGGRASYCTASSDGLDVACGGNATGCTTSSDGRRTACGDGRYTPD